MVLSLVMTLPVLFTLSIHTVFLYMMCVPFDCQYRNTEANEGLETADTSVRLPSNNLIYHS